MDVYTRMSNEDANDYDKLKKAPLTSCNFTEDGYSSGMSSQMTKRQTSLIEESAKFLDLSGSSTSNFNALVDLIVKE